MGASQEIGNYWIHVIGLGDCEVVGVSQAAILRYKGVPEMHPHTGDSYADGNRQGSVINGDVLFGSCLVRGLLNADNF